jgi:hypothetical protein
MSRAPAERGSGTREVEAVALPRGSAPIVRTEHVRCVVCGAESTKPYRRSMYRIGEVRFDLVRCPCGMVYVDPRPDGPSIGLMYADPSYYTEGYNLGVETENYFDRRDELVRQYTETAEELAREIGHKGDLLELGSAGGFFIEGARLAGFRVRGVELSPGAVEYSRRELGHEVFEGLLRGASTSRTRTTCSSTRPIRWRC